MRFVDYLQSIHIQGSVDSCKIDCKGDFMDCEALDTDISMKLEASWKSTIKGFNRGNTMAIYDLAKLINMLSYSEEDVGEDGGEVWIDNEYLHYEGRNKKVDYRLADPELIDKAELEKTIGDFLDEEEIEFVLNATHIRELIKGLSIVSAECIKIYTEGKHIKAELGDIDKLTIKVDKFKKLTDVGDIAVLLQAKNLSSILRTALQLKGTVRVSIKEDFPAVLSLENVGEDIRAVYLISPAWDSGDEEEF
jgi:hypothetical protein